MRKSPGATGAPLPAPRTGGHSPATRPEKAGAPLLRDDPQTRLGIGPGRQAVLQGMLAGPAGLDRPRGLAETRCGRGLDHTVMLDEGPAGLVVVIMGRFVHRQDRREAGVERLEQPAPFVARFREERSEEHTSELQSLMRISYAVFCLKKKNKNNI